MDRRRAAGSSLDNSPGSKPSGRFAMANSKPNSSSHPYTLSAAACPALSASNAKTILGAKRLSFLACFSVIAVPQVATARFTPAKCAPITSV